MTLTFSSPSFSSLPVKIMNEKTDRQENEVQTGLHFAR